MFFLYLPYLEKNQPSIEQEKHEQQNKKNDTITGDKKLDGPNRPST